MVAPLTLLQGESLNVLVAGRRLLIPLSDALAEFVEAYNVKIAVKIIEYWRWFLKFFEHIRLPTSFTKRVEIRRRATKFLILKDVCINNH